MRIQHNIMAMGAYRNYTNNLSAMRKNLEKLSSGYKINRAGDDAAGLAISEKMRAQITGLETAQKNAKDGISLVQTAEGALTEVHDMLNRMVQLATQSANGTYDNETDRFQLQKEVDQLKEEINRIADSANFNGIKLLDGSMDSSKGEEVTTTTDAVTTQMDASFLPVKGGDLGVNTVLHKEPNSGTNGTTFSVDLHNTVFSNGDGKTMTLTVGDQTWTLEGDGNGALKGEDLVNALVDKITENAVVDADGNKTVALFGGQNFTVSAGTDGDNRITFQQVAAPSDEASTVDGDMKVDITGDIGSGTASAGVPAQKAVYTIDLSNATGGDITAGATFSDAANAAAGQSAIDGINVTFDGNIDKTMQKFVEDYNSYENAATGATKNYVASWDGKVLTLTAKYAGALDGSANGDGTTVPTAAPALSNVGDLTVNKDAVKDVQSLDLTGATQADIAAKSIDGVAIDWVNEGADEAAKLDATMQAWVEKYNGETSKAYTAEWANNKLTLTAKVAGKADGTSVNTGAPAASPTTDIQFAPAVKQVYAFDVTAGTGTWADGNTLVINGTTYTYDADGADGTLNADATQDAASLASFIADKLSSNEYDIFADNGTILFTAKTAGAGAPTVAAPTVTSSGTNTAPTLAANAGSTVAGADAGDSGAPVTFTSVTAGDDAKADPMTIVDFTETQAGSDADGDGVVVIGTADYNFKTTAIKNVTAESGERLASTYFDLTEDMVVDGGSFTIGKQSYTFSSDAADDGVEGKVYIGDLVDSEGNVDIANNLDEIAQRITDAAKDNTTWTVGHDKGGSTLSFVEKQDQTEYVGEDGKSSLNTVDNIASTFSWTGVGTSTTETVGAGGVDGDGTGKALTLQIGDTAEEFNQLKVDIKDMHVKALGLGDLDISTQEGAAAAVDAIKAAINKVSDVRGTLGATQNRLDHTINNLSVMTENIQDAESTIRDTDVADEMMAYTKNNILIQSAQAMLAQANQVPQGVLQLLQ